MKKKTKRQEGSIQQHDDINLEVRRKIFHIFLGVVLVILIYYGIVNALILFLLLIIGGLISLISKFTDIPVISWLLKTFERPEQLKRFPGKGMISFFIGVLLVVKLFPMDIALASILILSFGDSVSHIYGTLVGKKGLPWNKKKTIEGTIYGTITATLASSIIINPLYALIASISAMGFESIEIKTGEELTDDNILIPLIAGTVLLILRNYGVLIS